MNRALTLNADLVCEPAAEVSLVKLVHAGEVIRRVPAAAALQLIDRGFATWRGTGSRRHLELTDAAPLSNLRPALSRGTTRPARAAGRPLPNGTQSKYLPNQRLGDSRSTREHTLPREF